MFRRDLEVTPGESDGASRTFLIHDPVSGDTFQFGEPEYFLCQRLDGNTSHAQIQQQYAAFFGKTITASDVVQLIEHLDSLGLAEPVASRGRDRVWAEGPTAGDRRRERRAEERWSLGNPASTLLAFEPRLRPLRWLALFLVYSLVLGLPVAGLTLYNNQDLVFQDLATASVPLSYLGRLLFTLFFINLLRCLANGTVITHYGGRVREFGIRLRFGLIPRFYIDRSAEIELERSQRLWCNATSLLLRLVLFQVGVMVWYLFRPYGTQLSGWGSIFAQSALIGFVFVSLPFRRSDGYKWLVTRFDLPPNMLQEAVQVTVRVLRRQAIPSSIPPERRVRMVVVTAFVFALWGLIFLRVSSSMIAGLERSFPGVFGRSTPYVIGLIVVATMIRWLRPRVARLSGNDSHAPGVATDPWSPDGELLSEEGGSTPEDDFGPVFSDRAKKLAAMSAVGLALLLPYPFQPGGEIQAVPPRQQELQAPVSGQIVEVMFDGGDGRLIEAGTVVARMISSDLDNSVALLKERVQQYEAEYQKAELYPSQLERGPSAEEAAEARARVAQADEEIKRQQKQREAAVLSLQYNTHQLERLEALHRAGVHSLFDLEEMRRKVELDRIRIAETEAAVAGARKARDEVQASLEFLLRGAEESDIEAARQEAIAASARLRQAEQELRYAEQQNLETELKMPMDGTLTSSYLKRRIASHLTKGETFAVVQDDAEPLVELEIPEYDAGEVHRGSEATVKLLAFPNEAISGTVVSMEPTTSKDNLGHVFKVVIRLEDLPLKLKPGMTGFGKIHAGHKPVIVLLTRPILRFFRIEVWSWLP